MTEDSDPDWYDLNDADDGPRYRAADEIHMWELPKALGRLAMFKGDPFLTMQATNLGLIDRWLIDIEAEVLERLIKEERTPIDDAMFLSAQTQMWIFAAYEVMRTWQQRAKEVLKLVKNSGLHLKIEALERELGYLHTGREIRARQLREVQDNPTLAIKIEEDLRRIHIVFKQLEALRISFAKHEVPGKPNLIAMAPGYGRIDRWTGSLMYELGSGKYIFGYISRRNVADSIRAIDHDNDPQTAEELSEFDDSMKSPD